MTMKTRIHTLSGLLSAVILLMFSSCTHNNGDIGPLYGQWKLISIDADGIELPEYKGDVFWCFQGGAIQILSRTDQHEFEQRYGNWSLTDGDTRLVLTFPDTRWPALQSIGLQETSVLRVIALTSRDAVFELSDTGGTSITYTLRKW